MVSKRIQISPSSRLKGGQNTNISIIKIERRSPLRLNKVEPPWKRILETFAKMTTVLSKHCEDMLNGL